MSSSRARASSAPPPAHGKLLADEEAIAARPACRKLVKRTTAQQVQKKYWDHFRDFNDYQKYILVWDGLTLDDRLSKDTHATNEGCGPTMGACYYKNLRLRYSVHHASQSQLVVRNPAEEVRMELRAA